MLLKIMQRSVSGLFYTFVSTGDQLVALSSPGGALPGDYFTTNSRAGSDPALEVQTKLTEDCAALNAAANKQRLSY